MGELFKHLFAIPRVTSRHDVDYFSTRPHMHEVMARFSALILDHLVRNAAPGTVCWNHSTDAECVGFNVALS